ncbi:MAG: hypothetical protein A2W03_13720 [Candidatus Aminicenantes bacterium RBG_16_63_16]|nr:MAG: hypothetical protein A2W03_13720 [Candidatus Aminicenantes bacterium RBG_16_63_16]
MTKTEATSEIFWRAFRSLSKKSRAGVIERMLRDSEFREDLIDIVTIEQRLSEESLPLEDYLRKRKRKRG